jgi:phosphoglycolate phosphatase-like HAD superfamily hydrolase
MRQLIERHRPGTPAEDDELDRAARRAVELHHGSEQALLRGDERDLTELALTRLRDAGHRLALLTGNLEPIARRKMELSGLDGLFPPRQGAFGSDAEARPELVPIARGRAGHGGRPHPRADTVLIGDTPLDVEAAQGDGVRCIGVSGARFSEADLLEAGADAVVASVPGVEFVLAGWES